MNPIRTYFGGLLIAIALSLDAQGPSLNPDAEALAHRVLDAGLQFNGLARAQSPWRLKAIVHIHPIGAPHPVEAQFEEWFTAPHRWRRTFSSVDPALNGTEWSLGPHRRFLARREHESLQRLQLDLRIAGPLTDPLARAASLRPDDPLELRIVASGDLTLNCLSAITPDSPAPYPTMCFDRAHRLRLLSTLSSAAEFDHYETFRGRAIPRSMHVLVNGSPFADIDISLLEPLPPAAPHLLDPPRDAIAEPILLQPGDPAPVSVFEIAAHPTLKPDGYPYRGASFLCVVVDPDGRAHLDLSLTAAVSPAVLDSLEIAVRRWRFQPYLIDGHPVRVEVIARYTLDGHPFVPLFQHPHVLEASDLEAYLEAHRSGSGASFSSGPPIVRRGRR